MVEAQSITAWNRIEPTSRSNDLMPSLAARVHDPLWFLTRQWQFREFEANDSGSAAWIEVATAEQSLRAVGRRTGETPIDPATPLESFLDEPLTMHLALRAELGQIFEQILREAGLESQIEPLRAAFPIPPPGPAEIGRGDAELVRAQAVLAGRVIDGGGLYLAMRFLKRGTPPQLVAPLQRFIPYVDELLRGAISSEPPAWNAEQLEYELDVVMHGTDVALTASPRGNGELTWDVFRTSDRRPAVAPSSPVRRVITVLPSPVQMRGTPEPRFWDFDSAERNLGAVEVGLTDAAKLVAFDALLDPRNDSYIVPVEQEIGTLLRIDSVLVRDVFGVWTIVPPAPTQPFTASGATATFGRLLAPIGAHAIQYGEPFEIVRFARDEMLDIVWAIEDTIEGDLGQPLRGRERSARRAPDPAPIPSERRPIYRLRNTVPGHWFAYVPIDGATFERDPAASPATRILQGTPRIREEELRRTGLRISRLAARCRDAKGRTLLWVTRRKEPSDNDGGPAVAFDWVER